MELDTLIDNSSSHPNEEDLHKNLSQLNKKLSSLLLRTEHQITITNVNISKKNLFQDSFSNALFVFDIILGSQINQCPTSNSN